jgi:hypothetical protein
VNLRVIREPSVAGATLGVLFVDDVFAAFTLEDQLREVPGVAVASWKVYGATAIPAGRYRVRVTFSRRFQKPLPELIAVPGFEGIRLHAGNVSADTHGCVLVGLQRADARVLQSRPAMQLLQERIEAAAQRGEDVFIVMENPPSYRAA